jgi:hypothetical protein
MKYTIEDCRPLYIDSSWIRVLVESDDRSKHTYIYSGRPDESITITKTPYERRSPKEIEERWLKEIKDFSIRLGSSLFSQPYHLDAKATKLYEIISEIAKQHKG